MSSTQSPFRKEWRVVAEQSARSAGDEDMNRSKIGQTDERTIYEVQQGQEHLELGNFCSIQMDGAGGALDSDSKQKLLSFARRREELMQMEIELRAQMIAKSQIMELRSSFDAQIKEQASTAAKLQEQLHDREHRISDLERIMQEKERELQEIRLDNEEAWAKEDLLREQNMELANFRREHDNIEAERASHLKQIHDLQEHIQEKDRQFIELQEQHRTVQDTVLFKEEQLRDAQAWITRAQEMDALHSSTNHALQNELRERTDQYNQLWLACQRQFAEMERLHMQNIQQLQHELAGLRGKNGTPHEELYNLQPKATETPQFGMNNNNGSHVEANGIQNSGNMSSGKSDNSTIYASSDNTSAQANHASSVPVTPAMGPSYLSHGQVAAMHPNVMNQEGLNQSAMHGPQSQVSHFSTVSPVSSFQHWQGPQVQPEVPLQNQYPPSQLQANLDRSGSEYGYETAANGLHSGHMGDHTSHGREHDSTISSNDAVQAREISENSRLTGLGQPTLQQISSQFHNALQLGSLEQNLEFKESNGTSLISDGFENQSLTTEQSGSITSPSASEAPASVVNFSESTVSNAPEAVIPEVHVSAGDSNSVTVGKISDVALLDERSLLACIVRTIPAGGKIRISSTLPNRLGKMLAPLHWHDYKKKYGKLDDFVASHPELFVIEGDHIRLREGAQGIIAATAAVAKVAAAAAATPPNSSFFPSVAVTPMAQPTNRSRNASQVEPKRNGLDGSSQVTMMRRQHLNGAAYNNVKILSNSKDATKMTGPNHLPGKGHF